MAEKAIIGKMAVYETLTMVVPGVMIVFCVWLADPEMWSKNLWRPEIPTKLNYLFDTAIVFVLFAFSYVAGSMNYRLVDWFWRKIGLRNNICMIRGSLRDKIESGFFKNLQDVIVEKSVESMSGKQIEDVYYEAYTYALEKNSRSNIPFLENQVAMFKGLIFPMSWVIVSLNPESWGVFKWVAAIVVVIVLIGLAITRQKKIINLVLEDYEYEKRIERQSNEKQ